VGLFSCTCIRRPPELSSVISADMVSQRCPQLILNPDLTLQPTLVQPLASADPDPDPIPHTLFAGSGQPGAVLRERGGHGVHDAVQHRASRALADSLEIDWQTQHIEMELITMPGMHRCPRTGAKSE